MKVNSLRLRNADLRYKNDYHDKSPTAELKNFNLQVTKFHLDSASFFDPKRFFYAEAITAQADSLDFLLKGGFYRLRSSAVAAGTSGEIEIRNLRMVPQYSPRGMALKKKRSTSWMKLRVPAITMKEVDFPEYSRSGKVVIGSIVVEDPVLISFNDKKNFKEVPDQGEKLFPQDLVQQLKFGLDIRRVEIRNMFARLDEFNEKATRPGHMAFQKIYCTISNITNDKSRMSARNPAITRLRLHFKDKGTLRLVSRLNLLDPTCTHSLKGTLGKCDLQVFNSIMEPSFAVRIESGMVQKGDFNMRLTRNSASGKMLLLYQNFKIQLLRNDGKSQSVGDQITSFFANALVVEPSNPKDGGPPRRVDVQVTRKNTQSFISYWRHCLQTGFMTTVGLQKPKP